MKAETLDWNIFNIEGFPRRLGTVNAVGSTVFSPRGDVGRIVIKPNERFKSAVVVYAQSRSAARTKLDFTYPIKRAAPLPWGKVVCVTGSSSGTYCTHLARESVNFPVRGRQLTINGLGRLARCSKEGDSGGPVYKGGQALGTIVGRTEEDGRCKYGVMMSAKQIEAVLEVTIAK